jgi:hypothetical protein
VVAGKLKHGETEVKSRWTHRLPEQKRALLCNSARFFGYSGGKESDVGG